MRRVKLIVTKDHFLYFVDASNINDELIFFNENDLKTDKQVITYYSSGNCRDGYKNNSDEWEHYVDWIAPIMHARSSIAGGCSKDRKKKSVALINNIDSKTAFGQIIAKEHLTTGFYKTNNNANEEELSIIENNPNQTVVISEQCKVAIKRSLETFEEIVPEAVPNPITEEELNIDWGE